MAVLLLALIIVSLGTTPGNAANGCGIGCSIDPSVSAAGDGLNVVGEAFSPGLSAQNQPSGGSSAATCSSCQWAVVPVCDVGSGGPGASQTCDHSLANCPTGQVDYRVYLRTSPTVPWQVAGSECLSPATAAAAGPPINIPASVANYFQHMPLPPPGPSFQPADGAVVNIPTIFSAGGGNGDVATFNLGGTAVRIAARPAYWIWTFDNGVSERFDKPGGPYPDTDVTYTYHEPGTRTVTVTAVWTASYAAGGVSAPVAGTVRRSASLTVPVHVARSELVSQ